MKAYRKITERKDAYVSAYILKHVKGITIQKQIEEKK